MFVIGDFYRFILWKWEWIIDVNLVVGIFYLILCIWIWCILVFLMGIRDIKWVKVIKWLWNI